MSTVIDTQVVEMKFDARDFDNNVQHTMSLLDRFKATLNLDGAEKSFKKIEDSASDVSLDGLIKSAEVVENRFSVMSIAAITAISNIVNSAMNAGKQIVASLTIDQVTSGFTKYEEKVKAVQTIMNATGLSIDEVSAQLEKLAWFTDETSYSFTDMVSNIGKFTANNIPLERSVTAMQGIANWAALSGQGVNEASRAMYNLSQAISVGAVKLIDWKSIENANMATTEFKQTALDTAVALGTLVKQGDVYKGVYKDFTVSVTDFNSELSQGWFNSEVLLATLDKYGEYANAVFERVEETGETCAIAMEHVSDEMMQLGSKAFRAAQEAKTFTDAIEATKDAVSTGWMQTYELIFGNYEEAKTLWTDLANTLYDIFASSAETRNEVLEAWNELGGRRQFIDTVTSAYEALLSVVVPIRDAISDAFPPVTAETIMRIVGSLKAVIESFKLTENAATTLYKVVSFLLIPFQVLFQFIRIGLAIIKNAIIIINTFANQLIALGSNSEKLEKVLRKIFGDARYEKLMMSLNKITENFTSSINNLRNAFSKIKMNEILEKIFETFSKIGTVAAPIINFILDGIIEIFDILAQIDFSRLISSIGNLIGFLGKLFLNLSLGKLGTILFIATLVNLATTILSIGKAIKSLTTGISGLGNFFENLTNPLENIGGDKKINKVFKVITMISMLAASIGVLLNSINGMETEGILAKLGVVLTIMVALSGIIIAMSKFAKDPVKQTMVLLSFSLSIKILLNSLNSLDVDGIIPKLIVVVSIMTILEVVAITMSKFAKNPSKQSTTLIGFALSVKLLLSALNSLETEGILPKLVIVTAIMAILEIVAITMSKFAKNPVKQAAILLSFALSVKLLLSALNNLETEGILPKLVVLISIMVMLELAIIVMSKFAKNPVKQVAILLSFALSVKLLLSALNSLETDGVLTKLDILISVMALLSIVVISLSHFAKDSVKQTMTLLSFALSIKILLSALNDLKTDNILPKLNTLLSVMALLTGVTITLSHFAKDSVKQTITLISFALSIKILLSALNNLETDQVLLKLAVLTAVMGLLDAVIITMSKFAKDPVKQVLSLLAFAASIRSLVTALNVINTEGIEKKLIALVVLVGLMDVSMVALSKINVSLSSAFSVIIEFIALSVSLSLLLDALNNLNTDNLLIKLEALVLIVGSLIGTLFVMNKMVFVGSDMITLLEAVGIIVAFLGILTVAAVLLNQLDLNNITGEIVFLTTTALALTALLKILGSDFKVTAGMIQAVVMVGSIMLGLVGILALISLIDDYLILDKVMAMIAILTAVTVVTALLGLIGPMATGAIKGAAALVAVIAIIGTFMGLVGALLTNDTIMTALEKGSEFFTLVGSSIGNFIGSIIGGIAEGITSKLPNMGTNLSDFMTNLEPFLTSVSSLSNDTSTKVQKLVEMLTSIATLGVYYSVPNLAEFGQALHDFAPYLVDFAKSTADIDSTHITSVANAAKALSEMYDNLPDSGGLSDFIGGIVGSADLSKFGEELSDFGPKFANFAESVEGISADHITSITSAASAIASLESNLRGHNGWAQTIFGDADLQTFGYNLEIFGESIRRYYDAITMGGGIDVDIITTSTAAAESLAELESNLRSHSGWAQTIFGDADLSKFGNNLETFGVAIKTYYDIISADGGIDGDIITSSAAAANSLVELESNLKGHEGWAQTIFGDADLSSFGSQLSTFADAMVDYSSKITSGEGVDVDAVKNSAIAGEALAELEKTLPSTDGKWAQWFGGTQTLNDFAVNISAFGSGLSEYGDYIKDVDFNKVMESAEAGTALALLDNSLPETNGIFDFFGGKKDFSDFGKGLKDFGDALNDYSVSISSIKFDMVNESIKAITDILTLSGKMSDSEIEGITLFSRALYQMANSGVDSFITTFEGSEITIRNSIRKVFDNVSGSLTVNDDNNIGRLIANAILNTLTNNTYLLESYGGTMISYVVRGLNDNIDSVTFVGKDIVFILASSMSAHESELVRTLEKMIKNTASNIKNSNSITKETNSIGQNVVKGIIKGIESKMDELKREMQKMSQMMIDTSKQVLDEHSPSVEFNTIGKNTVEGLVLGISKNEEKAFNAASELSEGIINTTQKELAISSSSGNPISKVMMDQVGVPTVKGIIDGITQMQEPLNESIRVSNKELIAQSEKDFAIKGGTSEVMKNQIGVYLIKGIADGIYSDMSAEEAASHKAENIVKAFQESLNRLSIDSERSSTQYQLWEEMYGEDASDDERLQQQILDYERRLANEGQALQIAQATYMANLKEFGEDSLTTIQSLKDWETAQLNFAKLINEYRELVNGTTDETVSQTEAYMQAAAVYREWLNQYKQQFLDLGYSMEEIKEMAQSVSGWNPDVSIGFKQNGKLSYQDVYDRFVTDDIEVQIDAAGAVIQDRAKDTVEASISSGTRSGTSSGLSSGFSAGVYDFSQVLQSDETLNEIDFSDAIGKAFGEDLRNSSVSAINFASDGTTNAIFDWGDSMINGIDNIGENILGILPDIWDEHSPSKEFYKIGSYAMEGLHLGLSSYNDNITSALTSLGKEATQTIVSYQTKFNQAGITLANAMIDGLVSGIRNRQAEAINEIINLVTQMYQFASGGVGMNVAVNTVNKSVGGGGGGGGGTSAGNYFLTNAQKDAISQLEKLAAAGKLTDEEFQSQKGDILGTAKIVLEPVIDTSATEKQIADIQATTSTYKASSISASLGPQVGTGIQNSSNGSGSGGTTYNFYQTNNSPTALSRIDIYRDTSNLLSAAKGVN